jgi:hypothetical protein
VSCVDVLLGAVRMAALASSIFLIWFFHKALRNLRREAAASPDPRRRRRTALQGALGMFGFLVADAIAFFVGRALWGPMSELASP